MRGLAVFAGQQVDLDPRNVDALLGHEHLHDARIGTDRIVEFHERAPVCSNVQPEFQHIIRPVAPLSSRQAASVPSRSRATWPAARACFALADDTGNWPAGRREGWRRMGGDPGTGFLSRYLPSALTTTRSIALKSYFDPSPSLLADDRRQQRHRRPPHGAAQIFRRVGRGLAGHG